MPGLPDPLIQDLVINLLPLEKVKPDPGNMRQVTDAREDEALAASIASQGQITPIKVRPEPGATGAFIIVGGHRRYRACKKLGLREIKAIVLPISEQQAILEGILDNRGQELIWLEIYESVEKVALAYPDLTQAEIGKKLMIDQSRVSHAMKCLKLLDKSARKEIYANYINSGDPYLLPEACMKQLVALGEGGLPDRQKMQAALRVSLQRRLPEAKVAKLVAWTKLGKNPSDFPENTKSLVVKGVRKPRFDQDDPKASLWQALPRPFKVRRRAKGYRLVLDLPEAKAVVAIYGAAAWLNELELQAGSGDPKAPFKALLPSLMQNSAANLKRQKEAFKPVVEAGFAAPGTQGRQGGLEPANPRVVAPPTREESAPKADAGPAASAAISGRMEEARLKVRAGVEKIIGTEWADKIGMAADDWWKAMNTKRKRRD